MNTIHDIKPDSNSDKVYEKKLGRIVGVALVLLMVFGAGISFGRYAAVAANTKPAVPDSLSHLTEDQFAPFWRAWSLIDQKYVDATSTTPEATQKKIWGAIQGLTASLGDPYTVFFPPEESKAFEADIAGNFEGVGMEIGLKDNALTVVAPLKNSPAERAGVQTGDKILKINDTIVADMPVEQAIKLIRGKKGTTVRITFGRGKETIEKTITREVINIPTIEVELKKPGTTTASANSTGLRNDGIFVIRLFSFNETSPRVFRDALRAFVESGSHKLILDLRGNPGGYLEAAQDIASWFLPLGKVIVTEDFGGKRDPVVYRSKGYNIFKPDMLKMVILVNGGSASASEILAGSLKEHKVAKLVGTKTFGKGSVQELIKITPETSLKITVARWLTPDGHNLSHDGLVPDVVVELTDKDREDIVNKKADKQLDKAVEILKAL